MQQNKYEITYSGITKESIIVWAFSVKDAIEISKKMITGFPNIGEIIKIEKLKET